MTEIRSLHGTTVAAIFSAGQDNLNQIEAGAVSVPAISYPARDPAQTPRIPWRLSGSTWMEPALADCPAGWEPGV